MVHARDVLGRSRDASPPRRGSQGRLGSLPDEERCTRIRTNGERCKQPRMVGLKVCAVHGGRSPGQQAKHRQAIAVRELAKLPRIEPIAEDDDRCNPVFNLAHQVDRRQLARVVAGG